MVVATQVADDFTAWVEPHLPAMARYASRLVPPADGDDVVQEAMLRAWQRWETYDDTRGTPLVWLLGIVRDRARRHRRGLRRTEPLPELPLMEPVAADLDLERAIRRLTARQRSVVDLYYFVGLDIATVAAVMGCAPGTVKATLHQARGRLRELIGGDDDGTA